MEQKIEIWKPVKNFEGLYSVSSLGRVRSEDRIDSRGCFRKGIILSPRNLKGYLRVALNKNGIVKDYLVHRLVAETFIPNPDNLPFINHKSENKTQNFVYINDDGSVDLEKSNLEWITHKVNCNHATRNKRIGEKLTNGKSSKRVYQYTLDGEFVREWPSLMEIQRQLGFRESQISQCCNGKIKSSYGFIWRYADDVYKENEAA